MIEAEGIKLNVERQGTGSPAVVFDSGLGASSTSWCLIAPEIAKTTTVVTWDRPGLGLSQEDGGSRSKERIAGLLRSALRQSGVAPPYVLVGHSLGGLHVRQFAVSWPNDVAGVVLVDPTTEHMGENAVLPAPAYYVLKAAQGFIRTFGNWTRKKNRRKRRPAPAPPTFDASRLTNFSEEQRQAIAEEMKLPKVLTAAAAEREAIGENIKATKQSPGPFPDVPLVVISSDVAKAEKVPLWARALGLSPDKLGRILIRYHQENAKLSAKGRWVLAPSSSHWIPHDAPGTIIDAINEVVEQSR